MIEPRSKSWRYWFLSAVLLTAGAAGWGQAYGLLAGLTVVQLFHFIYEERKLSSFPVQVRFAYLVIVLLFYQEPLRILYWIPLIGTWAIVLTGYCFLARVLSLAPWNSKKPLSRDHVRRTIFSKPVRGNILQGLSD